MATFTSVVSDLEGVGPCLDVRLDVTLELEHALIVAGQEPPAAVPVLALVDTGASVSVIQTGIADDLGLRPIGVRMVNTATHGAISCNNYAVRWLFPNDIVIESTAIEAPLQDHAIKALIGRNVLSSVVLIYIGYENQFTFCF